MSKVSVVTKEVRPTVEKVIIELTPREAAVLRDLVGCNNSADVLQHLYDELREIDERCVPINPKGHWRLLQRRCGTGYEFYDELVPF
jgi:hypothetical protein